jgi:hypothetical protein
MAQTIFIQLTTAGPDTGPFDIYSIDALGIVTGPFETNISRAQLLSGFVSVNVPNNCVKIRLVSKSVACPNILDLLLPVTTTTTAGPTTTTTTGAITTTSTSTVAPTTTTTTSTTTSTSTTTIEPTTTTTTQTTSLPCITYNLSNPTGGPLDYSYVDCFGVYQPDLFVDAGSCVSFDAKFTTLVNDPGLIRAFGPCATTTTTVPPTTTTTTDAPPTTTTTTEEPVVVTTTTLPCTQYNVSNPTPDPLNYSYLSCVGVDTNGTVLTSQCVDFFAATDSVVADFGLFVTEGPCGD